MSAAARSLVVFGGYLVALGTVLVLAPNPLLALFGAPPVHDAWIRVAGMLLLLLAYMDVRLGREEVVPYMRLRVHVRAAAPVFLVAFVLAGLARPTLLVTGAIDLAGALWTAWALRASPRPRTDLAVPGSAA